MKHLLNNLSNEEKNRIREQHEGGISIDTSKFKQLTESKLGAVKLIVINEGEETQINEGTNYNLLKLCKPGDKGTLVQQGNIFALSNGSPFCKVSGSSSTTNTTTGSGGTRPSTTGGGGTRPSTTGSGGTRPSTTGGGLTPQPK